MTLKRSERNSIIEDYRNGILNPDYEVIPTKTKGRYTVRKRKTPLTESQLAELEAAQDNELVDEEGEPVKPKAAPRKTATKQSPQGEIQTVREKALYTELQNQLNSQMLLQLNELTNKVSKLKAWKKKVKNEMYEEVNEPPQQPQQQPQVQQQQPEGNAVNEEGKSAVNEQPEPQLEQQQPQTQQELYEYMNKIPQQAYEPQYEQQEPQQYEQPTYYSTRNSIDYSKFGF